MFCNIAIRDGFMHLAVKAILTASTQHSFPDVLKQFVIMADTQPMNIVTFDWCIMLVSDQSL